MARAPLTIRLIRFTGTSRSRANRLMLIPIGFKNSSSRISPGCIGSSNSVFFAIISSATLRSNHVQLWIYQDRRSVWYQPPNLLDLSIGDRHAAVCPVDQSVCRPDESSAVWKTVDHDVASRRNTQSL